MFPATGKAMEITDEQRRRAEESRLKATTRKRELALARQQQVAAEPPPQSPESKRLRPPEGCESPGDGPPTTDRPLRPPAVSSGLTPQAMRSLSMQPQAAFLLRPTNYGSQAAPPTTLQRAVLLLYRVSPYTRLVDMCSHIQ